MKKYNKGLYIKVTETQLHRLRQRAGDLGISVSEAVRSMIEL